MMGIYPRIEYKDIVGFVVNNKFFLISVECVLKMRNGKYHVLCMKLSEDFEYTDYEEKKMVFIPVGTDVSVFFRYLMKEEKFRETSTLKKIMENVKNKIICSFLEEEISAYNSFDTKF